MAKIYKEVTVFFEKVLRIGIEEDHLDEDFQKTFSELFWPVDSSDAIFETVADQYVRNNSMFIEGVGKAQNYDSEHPIFIDELDEYVQITVQ